MAPARAWPAAMLLLLLVISTAEAKPDEFRNKEDFRSCGGSKSCLGAQRLDRIRRKSGMQHKTTDELAQQLDQDGDLVS